MRVAKRLRQGALALTVAAAPFAVGQGAANAVENRDVRTATLTFFNRLGDSVTCTLTATGAHDTSTNSASGVSRVNDDPRCIGDLILTVDYKGDDGRQHRSQATVSNASNLQTSVDHVAGDAYNAHLRHYVSFPQCTPINAHCDIDLTTNPK